MTAPQPAEIELVLTLSDPRPLDNTPRLLELLSEPLDWTAIVGMLHVHRTVGTAWLNITDYALDHLERLRPLYMLRGMETTYRGQSLYVTENVARNGEVAAALANEGIDTATLKGSSVAGAAYRDPGVRLFNDNDLLVATEHVQTTHRVLLDAGYVQGWWNHRTGAAVPAPRREVLKTSMHSHQAYPYVAPLEEGRMLTHHMLDLHFSIDLMSSRRTDDAVRDMLQRRIPMQIDPRQSSLHQVDMLIFACRHLYKDATHGPAVGLLKDLVLYKFADILGLIHHAGALVDRAAFLDRARELGTARECFFALQFTEDLYPGSIPRDVLDALRPDDCAYLREVTRADGTSYSWSESLAGRMFDSSRALEP